MTNDLKITTYAASYLCIPTPELKGAAFFDAQVSNQVQFFSGCSRTETYFVSDIRQIHGTAGLRPDT